MRVVYRARAPRGAATVYESKDVRFCCERMRRWWGVLIGFGVRGCPASTSREVNLFHSRSQVGSAAALEVVAIDHCPFCGESVETCRVK